MFRGVKSLVRSVDRLVRLPPSTARIKQPLKTLFGHASSFLPSHHAVQASATGTSFAQNISSIARAPVHVRANLSLPARIALGRPLGGPFLPRAPAIPRHIAQVGLGTARNFSSSRPIFQNIADNVPIATRAFWEADWEVKGGSQVKTIKKKPLKKASKAKVADKLKPNYEDISSLLSSTLSVSDVSEDAVSHYFVPQEPKVTTYLTIPLAPSEQRRPLPLIDSVDLLPFPQIHAIHSAHELHATRVASLFRRLEAANVWSRNVDCECYGNSGGCPDSLRLIFQGWSEAEVRYVVGEAINGWCTLESVEAVPSASAPVIQDIAELSFASSTYEAAGSPILDAISGAQEISFVVPTLDFSTSTILPRDSQPNVWCDPPISGTATPSVFSDAEYESDDDFASADRWLSSDEEESGREQMSWIGEPPSFRSLDASWAEAATSPWLYMSSQPVYL